MTNFDGALDLTRDLLDKKNSTPLSASKGIVIGGSFIFHFIGSYTNNRTGLPGGFNIICDQCTAGGFIVAKNATNILGLARFGFDGIE